MAKYADANDRHAYLHREESRRKVPDRSLTSTVRVTKALADTQRVRILRLLERGELCVCQIVEVLALAPSTVSKHLSLLSAAGLVEMRKQGRWAYYRLPDGPGAESGRPLLRWLREALKNDATIARDSALLEEVLSLDVCCVARSQRCRSGVARRSDGGAPAVLVDEASPELTARGDEEEG